MQNLTENRVEEDESGEGGKKKVSEAFPLIYISDYATGLNCQLDCLVAYINLLKF